MDDDAALTNVLRVVDVEAAAVPHQLPAVADLTTTLGVERRMVKHNLDAVCAAAHLRRQAADDRRAVDHDRVDRGQSPRRLIADEPRRRQSKLRIGLDPLAVALEARRGAGAIPLLLHERFEALGIGDAVAFFASSSIVSSGGKP